MSVYALHPTPPVPTDAILQYKLAVKPGPSIIMAETKLWKELLETKTRIDDLESTHVWDDAKRITNPYETIHSSGRASFGLAAYNPLSRSYFKMVEILFAYGLFDQFADGTRLTTAHIAEGPGGFIEALLRRCPARLTVDTAHAITLRSTDAYVPGWKKSHDFLETHKQVRVSYGEDGTGNILKLANCVRFISTVGEGCAHIVTADGGFDFSEDFNTQEQQSGPLIAASLYIALRTQAIGGVLVCKVFDTMTQLSYELLYLLCHVYERVLIVKPQTSRPANSERYVIGINFRGGGGALTPLLDALALIVASASTQSIMPEYALPRGFIARMSTINCAMQRVQLANIRATLDLIESPERSKISTELRRLQSELGKKWCLEYGEALR